MELQELLDEWLIACWQNRPHDGLRDPAAPGRAFTPNEKYAALVEAAGYVPVALSAGDYIELLPATWRAINAYGVKISHRVYDSEELNPFRGQRSGVAAKQNLWEIHRDPYDVSRIWVRNHWDGGWITVFWKHLSTAPAPFGELAWDHARRQLAADGKNPAGQEIARAVESLLQRAHQGPGKPGRPGRKPAAKDRRVAARTKATAQPAGRGLRQAGGRGTGAGQGGDEQGSRGQARRRWCRCRSSTPGRRRRSGGEPPALQRPASRPRSRPRPWADGGSSSTRRLPAFDLLPDAQWAGLTAGSRAAYDEARISYHSELVVVATSTLREVPGRAGC